MLPIIRRNGGHRPIYLSDFFDSDFDSYFSGRSSRSSSPAINIKEVDKKYVIELALPGINKEDLKIEIEKDVIIISSDLKQEQNEEKNGYTRQEFGNYSFYKSYSLPENVKAEKISAEFTNGILNVDLPKSAETKVNRTVKIA